MNVKEEIKEMTDGRVWDTVFPFVKPALDKWEDCKK